MLLVYKWSALFNHYWIKTNWYNCSSLKETQRKVFHFLKKCVLFLLWNCLNAHSEYSCPPPVLYLFTSWSGEPFVTFEFLLPVSTGAPCVRVRCSSSKRQLCGAALGCFCSPTWRTLTAGIPERVKGIPHCGTQRSCWTSCLLHRALPSHVLATERQSAYWVSVCLLFTSRRESVSVVFQWPVTLGDVAGDWGGAHVWSRVLLTVRTEWLTPWRRLSGDGWKQVLGAFNY